MTDTTGMTGMSDAERATVDRLLTTTRSVRKRLTSVVPCPSRR